MVAQYPDYIFEKLLL